MAFHGRDVGVGAMEQLRSQLRDLHALHAEGILDVAEYAQLKAEAVAQHRERQRFNEEEHRQRQRFITSWHAPSGAIDEAARTGRIVTAGFTAPLPAFMGAHVTMSHMHAPDQQLLAQPRAPALAVAAASGFAPLANYRYPALPPAPGTPATQTTVASYPAAPAPAPPAPAPAPAPTPTARTESSDMQQLGPQGGSEAAAARVRVRERVFDQAAVTQL